ncbi:MAG TPA: hypothetical protein VMT92_01450 [Steroidobacteraceae bacterium]|nr:hypothetical protein [Steroidobacteraceae bacterium]
MAARTEPHRASRLRAQAHEFRRAAAAARPPARCVSYDCYQRKFLRQVKRVYEHRGIGFLREVRTASPGGPYQFAALGNAETLRRLDAVEAGFGAPAKALDFLPRAPRPSPSR